MSLKKYIICSFCVQSGKFYTKYFYTGTARGARNNYQVCMAHHMADSNVEAVTSETWHGALPVQVGNN